MFYAHSDVNGYEKERAREREREREICFASIDGGT